MWLPEPIYEALPYLYVAMGAAFIGGAVYIGVYHPASPYYVAVGVLSIVAGTVIYLRRSTARKQKSKSDLSESR
jgi:hypothetical protein